MRKKPKGPLAKYLAEAGIDPSAFAETINVTPTAVYRYCQGRIPDDNVKKAIALATAARVTPNDWLGIAVPTEAGRTQA
jgi:predicted transcriptional regulator